MGGRNNQNCFLSLIQLVFKMEVSQTRVCVVHVSVYLFSFFKMEIHFWKICFHVLLLIIKLQRHGMFRINRCSLSLARRCHYSSLKLTSAFCRDRLCQHPVRM